MIPTIKFLHSPTSAAWIDQAITHLNSILLDHSHCERKAAGVALNLMFRYPSSSKLVRIAQEELEHFEQVNQWLDRRSIALAPLSAPPHAAGLKAQIRSQEPDRMLDALLVSGLIEVRSHERLGLLAILPRARVSRVLPGPNGLRSAALQLATTYFDRAKVNQRLEELAAAESELLSTLHSEPRIHS